MTLNRPSLKALLQLYKSIPIHPGDIIVLLAVLIFIVFLFNRYWFNSAYSGIEFVAIQVDNQAPKLYPISKNQEITIEGPLGPSRIEVNNGKVHFLHSPCLNKQCVSHGWISEAGETVACLPNHISVSLKGRESRFDALNF